MARHWIWISAWSWFSFMVLFIIYFNFILCIHGQFQNPLANPNYYESGETDYDIYYEFGEDDRLHGSSNYQPDQRFKVVEDNKINDAIWNLDEYLTALEFTKNPEVQLKNSTIKEFAAFEQYFESGKDNVKTGAICTACKILIGVLVLHIRNHNATEKSIEEKLRLTCPLFRIAATNEVCYGSIQRLLPTAYYVLKNRPQLKVEAFCGFTFQQMGCSTDDPYLEWTVDNKNPPDPPVENRNQTKRGSDFIGPKPKPKPKAQPNSTVNVAERDAKPIKILQIADMHIDPSYMYKAPVNCQQRILCCRNSSDKPTFGDAGEAGFFATAQRCDPPMSLLELTLKHLVQKHPDIEMFYMTGDIVPHNIWSSTKEENSGVVIEASGLMYKYYPDIPIVTMVGNHEPHPVNFFSPLGAPEELNTRFIYDVTYESWKQSIPDNQKRTYFIEGFYIINHSESLKIIALNTNVCYGFNFWGMYDVKDPGGQLDWLIQELEESEALKQYVHIVGHVPPGHPDCNKVWSRNFYNIVSKFRSTIKAQFYGHTHYDELKLYYSPTEPGVPINPLYISPSLTPYDIHNPAYKLFYADRTTWDIVDYETWIFDLEEANKTPEKEPEWFQLYKATELYDIPDTRIENLAVLINRMAENKTIFDAFYQNYKKALPKQKEEASVYKQKQILCGIVIPYFKEENECNRVQEKVDGEVVSIPVY